MSEQRVDESIQRAGTAMKRRGILAAAGAVVAGIVAKQAAQPVAASTPMLIANTETAGILNPVVGHSGLIGSGASTDAVLVGDSGTGAALAGVLGTTLAEYKPTEFSGVYGRSNSAHAVFGNAANGIGVKGSSGGTIGVQGIVPSTSGAANTVAVEGLNQATGSGGFGVQGSSSFSHGVVGLSGSTQGASGVVAVGQSPGTIGFQAVAQGGATFAGYFFGDVSVQLRANDGGGGNFGVAGAKFAVVKGADGKYRGMYAMESPECWFEDFGTGKLVSGKATVTLESLFAYHVHTEDYHVFITEHDEHNDLHVTGRTAHGFAVQADEATLKAKGKSAATVNGTFSYRVVAKRNDITGERMPIWDMPPGVSGAFTPVVAPSKPAAVPEPARSVQPQPPSRQNPPVAGSPQGNGAAQGNAPSPVQPAPPPRP